MDERLVAGVTSVTIGRGVIDRVVDGSEPMVAVLSQPGAAATTEHLLDTIPGSVPVVHRELPDGEDAKALMLVEDVAAWLARVGLKRDGVVVGVGGGALTDVAGFIASTYMRGVECRYVPTTLLGAVDASIGGKTAVNVGGKNLLGTFNHPSRVVIDIAVLEQISSELLREGMAEAYKTGLIGDADLAVQIERDGLDVDLEAVVAGSIAVKAEVVEADFREAGQRAHLNFGHTVGHAVERLTGWRHGPSVGVGMVAAAAISEATTKFSDRSRVVETIARLGLPVSVDGVSPSEIEQLVALDKKGDSQGLKMVLLEAVGAPTVRYVDSATLAIGLQAIGIT